MARTCSRSFGDEGKIRKVSICVEQDGRPLTPQRLYNSPSRYALQASCKPARTSPQGEDNLINAILIGAHDIAIPLAFKLLNQLIRIGFTRAGKFIQRL